MSSRSEVPGRRHPAVPLARGAAALTALVLLVSGCTTGAAQPAVTVVTTAAGGSATGPTGAQVTVGTSTSAAGSIVVQAPGESAEPASDPSREPVDLTTTGSSSAGAGSSPSKSAGSGSSKPSSGSSAPSSAPSSSTPAVVPAATVSVTPRNGATKVDPLGRITARAMGGVITSVKIVNPGGRIVFHQFKINKSSYALIPELGYERRYTVQIGTKSAGGREAVSTSTFVTLRPKAKVSASITPTQGALVGTGQPIEITFSRPIADSARRSVESQISVTSTSKQGGAFRWYSSTVVRWRPATMWKANTRVTVVADIYGKQLTPGGYGAEDRRLTFNVIRDVRSVVNARTHLMSVYSGGRLVREMKVSLGNDKYPTPNGIYVVTQKLPTHVMDSSTWGLRGAGAYRTKVKWATRVSSGGIFVHGAPWSEYAQGNDNVSHGCINVTDALAEWYQKYSYPGDAVKVINSNGPKLAAWDGFGDWNIPFSKY